MTAISMPMMNAMQGVALPMPRGVSFRAPVLPWAIAEADERRFRRIVQRTLGVALLLAIALPFLPVVKQAVTTVAELPPPLVKLVLERDKTPPPPPAALKPERKELSKDIPPPDPTKPATEKPRPAEKTQKAATVPEARNPQPNKPPGEILDGVKRRAAGVGLLAAKDQLAELRGAPLAVQLAKDIPANGRGVGSGVGPGVGAGREEGLPVRNLITSNATGGSGGINTAAYSRDTGGGGLAGRATTLVEGVAGGGGGGGFGGGGVRGGKGDGNGTDPGSGGGTLRKSGSGKASRSIEDIRLVFERHKGGIYSIYNRALREDPSLHGKVVLELKIAPAGQVIDLRIVSSELKAAELESKLLARIRTIDFGAKDVETMVITYPLDFLPS